MYYWCMFSFYYTYFFVFFFFFKQKTAYEMRISDWSSDVCSSDLSSTDAASPWESGFGTLCGRRGPRTACSALPSIGALRPRWRKKLRTAERDRKSVV